MKRQSIYHIALTAVLAAMTTAMINIGFPAGPGHVHIGDAMILLAAVLLPTPYAMAVGAIGGGLHNLHFNVSSVPLVMWAPATVVIKAAMTVPFSARQDKMVTPRNLLALIPYAAITLLGYGFYEVLMIALGVFPSGVAWTAVLLVSMLRNSIQVLGSSVLFVALASVLDKIKFKQRLGLTTTS